MSPKKCETDIFGKNFYVDIPFGEVSQKSCQEVRVKGKNKDLI